ncbi:glycosyltransferase [Jannaschia marina]|uniref:glycosyltransferase n=1 Tax=Jannaschia marina TaxID=2741674 RepID=UPI0015C9441F|nr:glycosyltransferase family 2 protein [Jannaschia marina]
MKEKFVAFEFASVDSTPRGLSHPVPRWYAPALLLLFSILSVASLWAITTIPTLRDLFPQGDLLMGVYEGTHSISVRIYVLCYFISYAAFCHANILKKIGMALDLCVYFAFLCVCLDLASIFIAQALAISFPLTAVEVLSGLMGFAVYSMKLLERGRMPETVPMKIDTSRNLETLTRALLVAVLAGWVAIYTTNVDFSFVASLRDFALLGGIGPGVFLFIPAFFAVLYLGGLGDQVLHRAKVFSPDISVIVPAHNEAHIVEKTLRAIDGAAERYDGRVQIIFVDNASSDDTYALAKRVVETLEFAKAEVLQEPQAGKSNALNRALDAVETDYFVRIDSDTLIRPNAFHRAMRYFADPAVGVVGGLPLPPGGGIFDRARFVEAAVKHGLYSVGLAAINGLVGVPGMFVIFRTDLPRQLGGFVGGMNGEDTDMSLRIGELGYRLIVDPEVRYISEVPRTFAHMREQRMRWFRSTYHVTARCRAVVFSSDMTFRGKIVLPYMLVNGARRAMMVPLLLFGLIEYLGAFKQFDVLQLPAVLAVILGAQVIMSVLALVLNGYVLQVLYLPEYLVFRLLRAYFTLESNLSINLKYTSRSLYRDANVRAQKELQSSGDNQKKQAPAPSGDPG